jgi:hypothetical protein
MRQSYNIKDRKEKKKSLGGENTAFIAVIIEITCFILTQYSNINIILNTHFIFTRLMLPRKIKIYLLWESYGTQKLVTLKRQNAYLIEVYLKIM